MFIAIEGADGTGKSTLGGILAEKIGAIEYSTPPKTYRAYREAIDSKATPNEKYEFYKKGVLYASDEIGEILANGGKIVMDRYWLTTYTYHQLIGVKVSLDDFKGIVVPTLTIILSLGPNIQMQRLLQRGLSTGDKNTLDKQGALTEAFYRNALGFEIPFIIINTQFFSPNACAEIAMSAMHNL
jgi:thymidylate kinase